MRSPLPQSQNHIEDGYNMTLTVAPKDFGGRLWRNWALTTPELPIDQKSVLIFIFNIVLHTMWPRNLAPDHSNLGSTNLFLSTIDKSNFLSEIETGESIRQLFLNFHIQSYVAALGSSTPSILIKLLRRYLLLVPQPRYAYLVPGFVLRFPLW